MVSFIGRYLISISLSSSSSNHCSRASSRYWSDKGLPPLDDGHHAAVRIFSGRNRIRLRPFHPLLVFVTTVRCHAFLTAL